MKIIDLSLELYSGMPVFPGDPDVIMENVCTLEKDGWNVKRLHINSHDSTHVNVPIHSKIGGKTLDDFSLENFVGPARLYESDEDIVAGEGLIFHDTDITMELAQKIVLVRVLFVGLSQKFEFDLDVERYLLNHDIISFERLVNTENLPKKFIFHGAPLKIRAGDGSLVRAYAIVD